MEHRTFFGILVGGVCLVLAHGEAHAICRAVQPTRTEGDTSVISFDPTTMVLYVLAPDQITGYECLRQRTPTDGGVADAGEDGGADTGPDAGDGGALDAGLGADAARTAPDAMAVDGGVVADGGDDGGLPPMVEPSDAGLGDDAELPMLPEPEMTCPEGFVARATWGTVTHVVIQPRIMGTEGEAALVMPVPARPDVHLATSDLFRRVGELMTPITAYRTVEVPTASLGYQCHDPAFGGGGAGGSGSSGCTGGGGGSYFEESRYSGGSSSTTGDYYDPDTTRRTTRTVETGLGLVEVDEVISTGDYQVTAIRADSPAALFTWLDDNGFAHTDEDDDAFAFYSKEGAWFIAVRVHGTSRTTREVVGLQPLVVSYPSDTIPLMHRLQYHSEGGTAYTDAFVMAESRVDAADLSAHTTYAAATDFSSIGEMFGLRSGWLTRLGITRVLNVEKEDSYLESVPNLEERPRIEHVTEIQIPLPCDSTTSPSRAGRSTSTADDGCGCSSAALGRSGLGALLPIAFALGLLGVWRRRFR